MARSLSVRSSGTLSATLNNTVDIISVPVSCPFSITPLDLTLTNGTGSGQAQTLWFDDATLAASTNSDVDLYDFGGALDAVGLAIANSKVKLLWFKNTTADGTDAKFTLGGQSIGTTAFNSIANGSDTAEIGPITPGGVFLISLPDSSGAAVADTTNHVLRIRNTGAATGSYQIAVVGV